MKNGAQNTNAQSIAVIQKAFHKKHIAQEEKRKSKVWLF